MFNLNYYKSFLKLAVCRLEPLINFSNLRKMDVNYLNFKSEHVFSLLKVFQQLHTSLRQNFNCLILYKVFIIWFVFRLATPFTIPHYLKFFQQGKRKKEKVLLCLSGDSDISPLGHGFSLKISSRTDEYYYQNQIQTRITHRPISDRLLICSGY